MKVLSLFSGIGAHDLGFEWSGMTIAGQCEIDAFCRKVLWKHWPEVPKIKNIKSVTGDRVARACGHIDLISGGFPCQSVSVAGKGEGIGTEEKPTQVSGLFWEMLRVIREVQPCYLLIENVSALRTRGADEVLSALEREGYTCISLVAGAWAVGAPHKRERVLIVAYSTSSIRRAPWYPKRAASSKSGKQLVNAESQRCDTWRTKSEGWEGQSISASSSPVVEHAEGERCDERGVRSGKKKKKPDVAEPSHDLDNSNREDVSASTARRFLADTIGERLSASSIPSEQRSDLPQYDWCGEALANTSSERRQQKRRSSSCNEIAYARWAALCNYQPECDDESAGPRQVLSLAGGEGLEGCWHRALSPITQFPMPPGSSQYAFEAPKVLTN